jgi:hypothetical protein
MTRALAWAMAVIGGLGILVLVLVIGGLGPPGPVPIPTYSAPQVPTAQAPPVAAPSPPLIVPTRDSGNYTVFCAENWTKRDVLDNEMYRYCLKHENEGYDNLVSEINANISCRRSHDPRRARTGQTGGLAGDRIDEYHVALFPISLRGSGNSPRPTTAI